MIPLLLATAAAVGVALIVCVPMTTMRAVLGRPATVRVGVGLVVDPARTRRPSAWTRWLVGWRSAAQGAGFAATAGPVIVLATVWPALGFVLAVLATGSPQFALFAAVLPLGLAWMWLDGRRQKRALVVEAQLSGFLTSFLMHVESGLEPVSAMLRAAESTPAQLRAVLRPLTDAIAAGVTPADALLELKGSTSNPVIDELCTNVRIAMRAGDGLVQQLAMLADHVRVTAETRSEAARELLSPRVMSMILVCMGPLTYLAIWGGMPEWHARWSADLLGQLALTAAFTLNAVGAVLLYRSLRKATRA